jgi:hypothetical protein
LSIIREALQISTENNVSVGDPIAELFGAAGSPLIVTAIAPQGPAGYETLGLSSVLGSEAWLGLKVHDIQSNWREYSPLII